MGPEAVGVLKDHDEAISTLGAGLYKTQQDVTGIVQSVAALNDQVRFLRDDVEQQDRRVNGINDFVMRSLWGRLRWLFTGR